MGCGEGELAERFAVDLKAGKFRLFSRVDSLDLVALKDHITVCDIAHLPYKNQSVGCALFCLSLMGTNYWQFVAEALRTLEVGGVLIVAEVSSRLTDATAFATVVQRSGCKLLFRDDIEGYFVLFVFEKTRQFKGLQGNPSPALLKPCLYKKR